MTSVHIKTPEYVTGLFILMHWAHASRCKQEGLAALFAENTKEEENSGKKGWREISSHDNMLTAQQLLVWTIRSTAVVCWSMLNWTGC